LIKKVKEIKSAVEHVFVIRFQEKRKFSLMQRLLLIFYKISN